MHCEMADLTVSWHVFTDHIIHFDVLKRLVPKLGEDELLDALKHVAISVRGRLLVKSSLACRDAAGVKARNAILEEVRERGFDLVLPRVILSVRVVWFVCVCVQLSKKSIGVRRMDVAEKHSLCPDATKKTLEGSRAA